MLRRSLRSLIGVVWLLATMCARHDHGQQKCKKNKSRFSGDNLEFSTVDTPFVSCMSLEGARNVCLQGHLSNLSSTPNQVRYFDRCGYFYFWFQESQERVSLELVMFTCMLFWSLYKLFSLKKIERQNEFEIYDVPGTRIRYYNQTRVHVLWRMCYNWQVTM
jgi:hypothetical protein